MKPLVLTIVFCLFFYCMIRISPDGSYAFLKEKLKPHAPWVCLIIILVFVVFSFAYNHTGALRLL